MRCTACEHENPPGARFCNRCGAPVPASCSACGQQNPPQAAFCNACGEPLGEETAIAKPLPAAAPEASAPEPRAYTPRHLAERILRTRSTLEGERKHVSVLFCDLVDSTPLAEQLGAETMHGLMDRCFEVILEAVHRYEGTVNQFLGDGAMALFGAPLALEDAPRRAVAAALAIQRGLERLGAEVRAEHGAEFRMRIGIHSGPVVVGSIGDDLRMDYTAVGDTTNLADRLQKLAPAGGILISEATRSGIQGYFALRDAGALELKGKRGPLRAFMVEGELAARDRVEAGALEGLTPLVGRERALETLLQSFAAASQGRGRVIFLVGEAGIGKSRLLHELRHHLADRAHFWMEGRCASYGRVSAFHAIADAVRRRFGIEDRDDDARALARLEEVEGELGGELAWTLPYLRALLALPTGDPEVDRLDPATRRSEIFRALRARMLRAAEQRPFVLVIEDLHWVDAASEEFLAYLLESVPALPVLVLLTHRPGYTHPFGDRSYHERLALEPLDAADMERMAGAMLDASRLPDGVRELIAGKAEGNPFFVEEVVKTLLEDGSLRRVDGRVELARRLSEVRVPDSIQDVLMARIDRLQEGPKRALQLASVIGREFAMRLLERIHDAGPEVRPVVEELRALELVYEKAVHPELAFMFKHALTHDVAYESVLEARRRTLHRIVGSAIEELYQDRLAEHFEALAHHFSEAGELEKAFFYHERAAGKAAAAFANQAAAEHCRRALELAARLGDAVPREVRRGLEQRFGGVLGAITDLLGSAAAFRRAAALADTPAERALDRARASHSHFWAHAYAETEVDVEAALADASEAGRAGDEARAYALHVRSFEAAAFGDQTGFESVSREALALRPEHPEVLALASYLQGQRAEWGGDYETALREQERAVMLSRKSGVPVYVAGGYWFIGKALACLGRYGEALARLREALEVCERLGDRGWRSRILNTIAWVRAELGDVEGGEPFNRRSAELGEEMLELGLVAGTPELIGNARINLAGNRIVLGDADGADEALAPVRAELAADGDPWMRWRYGLHLADSEARLALLRGDPEAARASAAAEVEGARRHGARKLEARALEIEARSLLLLDRREEAEAQIRAALVTAEAIGYPPVRWRAHALAAELARRQGQGAEAERATAQARALFEAAAASVEEADLRRALAAYAARLFENALRP